MDFHSHRAKCYQLWKDVFVFLVGLILRGFDLDECFAILLERKATSLHLDKTSTLIRYLKHRHLQISIKERLYTTAIFVQGCLCIEFPIISMYLKKHLGVLSEILKTGSIEADCLVKSKEKLVKIFCANLVSREKLRVVIKKLRAEFLETPLFVSGETFRR